MRGSAWGRGGDNVWGTNKTGVIEANWIKKANEKRANLGNRKQEVTMKEKILLPFVLYVPPTGSI